MLNEPVEEEEDKEGKKSLKMLSFRPKEDFFLTAEQELRALRGFALKKQEINLWKNIIFNRMVALI